VNSLPKDEKDKEGRELPDVIKVDEHDRVFIQAITEEIKVQQAVQRQAMQVLQEAERAQIELQRAIGASESLKRLVAQKINEINKKHGIPDNVHYDLNPDTGEMRKRK